MDQITQTLGFDASQAIAEINRLDGVLQQFEQRLGSVSGTLTIFSQTAAKTFNAAASTSTTATQTISTGLQTVANQSTIASQSVQANVGRMTTSLGLLSRIVFTQAVVRALSQMRRAFEATANTASQFQKQIALIQTIDDSGQSFEQLSQSIQKTSDALNVPLLETAAALYQTISNQVGDAAQSQAFLNESLRFAKATNSDAASSVDLLSGVLKSFNLQASETDRVASVMFKTIDLGRVEANELANSFGRLGPIAKDAGLTLEEVAGGLSAITVRGSNTSEAITQLRAIISALIKPSEAMEKALGKLGFNSGEAALKTLGLAGTLDKLRQSTGGSVSEMAALFPNVRGLSGATSLLGDDLKSLTANISEMTGVAREFANERFLVATSTDAAVAEKALNELSNALTVNLGNGLVKIVADMARSTDGVADINNLVKIATPGIIGLGVALAGLATKFSLASLSGYKLAGSLNAVLTGLALVPAAAGAGESIGNFISDAMREQAIGAIEDLHEANEKEVSAFRDAQQKKVDAANKADQERVRLAQVAAQRISAAFSQEKVAALLDADSGVTALEKIIGRQITAMQDYVAALDAATRKTAEFRQSQNVDTATAQQQTAKLKEELSAIVDKLGDRGFTDLAGLAFFKDGLTSVSQLRNQIHELGNSTSISEQQIDGLRQKFLEFVQSVDTAAGQQFFQDDVLQLNEAFQRLVQLRQTLSQSTADPNLTSQLSILENVLAQQPGVQFNQSASAINSATGPSQAIATAWERAAAAAERTAAAAQRAASTPRNRVFGGAMHLSDGGTARGADSIPAMLSPGEFVVNAKSSRQFYSQLVAMNAGQTPVFRESGGTVNNYQIGDVNVNGGGTTQQTVDEIGRKLRREIRRGRLEL